MKEQVAQTEVENMRLLEKMARKTEECEESQAECLRVTQERLKLEEDFESERALLKEERDVLQGEADELKGHKEKLELEVARLREELDTVKGGSTSRSLRQSVECRQGPAAAAGTTRKTPGLPTGPGAGAGGAPGGGGQGVSLSEGGGGMRSANNSFCSDQRSETKSERERVQGAGSFAPKELGALLERAENYKKISEQLSRQIEEHKVHEYRQTLKQKATKIKLLKKDREELRRELARAKYQHQAEKNVLSENERKFEFILHEKDEELVEMKRKLNFFELDNEQKLYNVLSAEEEESEKRQSSSNLSALRSKSMENTACLNKKLARIADKKAAAARSRPEAPWKPGQRERQAAEVRRSQAWEAVPRMVEEERKEERLNTFDSLEGNFGGQGGISYRSRLKNTAEGAHGPFFHGGGLFNEDLAVAAAEEEAARRFSLVGAAGAQAKQRPKKEEDAHG